MRIRGPLLAACFVQRENRFRARVRLAGEEVAAHLPNSGRLSELLLPGRRVLLAEARASHRVTDYDLLMVQAPETLVSVDARLPNRLFAEALEGGTLAEFAGLRVASPEFPYGASRLDFLLETDQGTEPCVVEVKSVTLVRDGVGYFPDVVTQRGSCHLGELRRARQEGRRAAVVFVIQRPDARAFMAHDESDPQFGELLRAVAGDGVEVHAHTCRVSPEEVVLNGPVPVLLSEGGSSTASPGTTHWLPARVSQTGDTPR
jgi:sugar fermentation stimulation protein A